MVKEDNLNASRSEDSSQEEPMPAELSRAGLIDMIFIGVFAIVGPVIISASVEGSWRAILWGALAWTVSLVGKVVLNWGVRRSHLAQGNVALASVLGIASACLELGIAGTVLFLTGPPRDLGYILAFGVGAGSLEILFVLLEAIGQHPDDRTLKNWMDGAQRSFWVRHTLVLERLGAWLRHVGSRGMISITILGGPTWPFILAILAFAIMDGLADFGELRGWNWYAPRVHNAFFWSIFLVGVIEIVLTAFLWYSL